MYLATLVMAFFGSTSAFAASECAKPKSTNDVLFCIELNHPDVKKSRVDDRLIDGIQSSSTQFANPQLEFETLKGNKFGDVVGESRVAVSQFIEIGGKRSARAKKGRAEAEVVRAATVVAKDQAKAESYLNLIKYRQLLEEVAVLEEALSTYEKVDRQFSARPRLSPDQQVSFSIFKLAIGDYRHKLAALQSERRKAENAIKLIPELNFKEAVKFLPKRPTTWPKFESMQDLTQSPVAKEAKAQLEDAEASHDLAKASSWPDPVVSLVATTEVEATLEWQSYGIGVSLPLPLWNVNGGERKQTFAQKTKAEIEYRNRQAALKLEHANLVTSYNDFVSALNKSPAPKEIDKKHRSTEQLFYQGLISGALVIEAHRQILEFTQTQNELELETTQTLVRLYTLEGRLGDLKYE